MRTTEKNKESMPGRKDSASTVRSKKKLLKNKGNMNEVTHLHGNIYQTIHQGDSEFSLQHLEELFDRQINQIARLLKSNEIVRKQKIIRREED